MAPMRMYADRVTRQSENAILTMNDFVTRGAKNQVTGNHQDQVQSLQHIQNEQMLTVFGILGASPVPGDEQIPAPSWAPVPVFPTLLVDHVRVPVDFFDDLPLLEHSVPPDARSLDSRLDIYRSQPFARLFPIRWLSLPGTWQLQGTTKCKLSVSDASSVHASALSKIEFAPSWPLRVSKRSFCVDSTECFKSLEE